MHLTSALRHHTSLSAIPQWMSILQLRHDGQQHPMQAVFLRCSAFVGSLAPISSRSTELARPCPTLCRRPATRPAKHGMTSSDVVTMRMTMLGKLTARMTTKIRMTTVTTTRIVRRIGTRIGRSDATTSPTSAASSLLATLPTSPSSHPQSLPLTPALTSARRTTTAGALLVVQSTMLRCAGSLLRLGLDIPAPRDNAQRNGLRAWDVRDSI